MKTNIDKRTGINLDKIKVATVDQYLALLGLPVDGTELVRVTRLHDAMQLVPNKSAKLGNCNICRGKSHIDLSCCPFCGDGEIDDDPETVASRETKPEDTVIAEFKVLIVKRGETDEKAAAEKAESDRTKTTPATAPSPIAGQSLVVVPPTVLQSKRAAKKTGQKTSEQRSITVVEDQKRAFTIDDLDTANEKIKTHLNNAGAEIYEAALIVFHVFENKLWMLRRDENGTQKYASFKDWVGAEQSITWQYAYELTNLPKYFTREQASKIGSTKLTLSLRIDEEERRRLLESGDLEKMSVSEVKQSITQNPATQPKNPDRNVARDEDGRLRSGEEGAQAASGTKHLPGAHKSKSKPTPAPPASIVQASQPLAPRKPEPLTIVTCVVPTRIEFDMFAKDSGKGDRPPKKARELSDDPIGMIPCANGAMMKIVLYKDAGGFMKGLLLAESPAAVAGNDDDEGDE